MLRATAASSALCWRIRSALAILCSRVAAIWFGVTNIRRRRARLHNVARS